MCQSTPSCFDTGVVLRGKTCKIVDRRKKKKAAISSPTDAPQSSEWLTVEARLCLHHVCLKLIKKLCIAPFLGNPSLKWRGNFRLLKMSPQKKDRNPAAEGECYINVHSPCQNSKLPPLYETSEYAVLAKQLCTWIHGADSVSLKSAPIRTHLLVIC